MKFIFKRYLVTVVSVFILTQLIPSFSISESWYGLFYASFILSILFYLIRPLLNLVLLPLNLVTLNLSAWLVEIAIFYLWTAAVSQVKIVTWEFPGFYIGPISLSAFNLIKWQLTILLALAFIIINKLLHWFLK